MKNPTEWVNMLVSKNKSNVRRFKRHQPIRWEEIMNNHTRTHSKINPQIDDIAITQDTLTGRGGLSLFVRYLRGIGIEPYVERLFGSLRRSRKGLGVFEIFKQLICFFVDGTSRHLVYFDRLRRDAGYAAAIETAPASMISSHALKRFLRSFWWPRIFLFRRLLQKLFLWRLVIEQPSIIILGLDMMILDNNQAPGRQGVEPTYKKVKGFGALQLSWGRFIVDSVFRSGSKHCNHEGTAKEMIRHVVAQIRKHYRADVPIIIRFDSGFFDQKLFGFLESLEIGYIGAGKLYDDVKHYIASIDPLAWCRYHNDRQIWDFVEFGDRRGSWNRFRRALFLRPHYEDRQQLLAFVRPETVIYTNLGMGEAIDRSIVKAGRADLLTPTGIIETYHDRGADELVFRALKDFASETLPFKRFNQNAAWYYTMLLAFFVFESFKEDVGQPVVPVTAYPTTVRRVLIDFAAKIVSHSGKIILKVTQATWETLRFRDLWIRSCTPPVFVWM